MHGLTFEMKRAHWAAYRFSFDELRAHVTDGNEELLGRMTPARFDILYVVHQLARVGTPRVRQDVIWKRLGLHRSTVSKAVTVMEEIGYAVRDYLGGGARQPFVTLTAKGRRALHLALHIAFTKQAIRKETEGFFQRRAAERGRKTPLRRADMRSFLSGLAQTGRAFCRHFGRDADVIYPIDPLTEL